MACDPQILVVDGHDGAGKTTVAIELARRLGGAHVQPFAAPVGQELSDLRGLGLLDELDRRARAAVASAVAAADCDVVVLDRHWATVLTLANRYGPYTLDPAWRPVPPTVICWADVATIRRRHLARGEDLSPPRVDEYYCTAFREVAAMYGVALFDTTSVSATETADRVLAHPSIREVFGSRVHR